MEENGFNPYIPLSTSNFSASDWKDYHDNWLFHSADNFVNGGLLYQKMHPGEAQYSEWSQQMTATMYQNWYNSEPEKMKRAIEAGINPFVAASGIAGSGNNSVAPAPNSVSAKGADPLDLVSNAVSAFGGAFGHTASGLATLAKLRHEIKNIDQDTATQFEQMGFTALQSKAMSIQLKYLDEKEQIGVWQALATWDKTKAEWENLQANHRNILAEYDNILAQKDVLIAEKGELEARKILDEAQANREKMQAQFINDDNEFFAAHGYRLGTPIYESMRDMMVNGKSFDLEGFGNSVADYNEKVEYAKFKGQYRADEESAYNRVHNASMGAFNADPFNETYREVYDEIDALADQEKECNDILQNLEKAKNEGRISIDEYNQQSAKVREVLRSIQHDSKELSKQLRKMQYSAGHASQLQDLAGDLLKIGVAVGGYSLGVKRPTTIKGFTR